MYLTTLDSETLQIGSSARSPLSSPLGSPSPSHDNLRSPRSFLPVDVGSEQPDQQQVANNLTGGGDNLADALTGACQLGEAPGAAPEPAPSS